MKDSQHKGLWSAILSRRPRFMFFVVCSGWIVFAFFLSACSANLTSTADAASLAHAPTAANMTSYPVTVFFSKFPESLDAPTKVYAVDRASPTIAVATFSLQLLIAGPDLSEQQAGYFTELNSMLSGPSNCAAPRPVGGPDFTLALDRRGSTVEVGTATVKFCRRLESAGIGADERVTAEITTTLKQFSRIKNVVILTEDGHCFGDESGKDRCLS